MLGLAPAHTGGGLVEQDDVGPADDGDADLEGALLGVGQHAGRHVAAGLEVELLHHRLRPRPDIGRGLDQMPEGVPIPAGPQRAAAEILEHGEAREDVRHLKRPAQAAAVDLVGPQVGDILALEPDASGAHRVLAGDEIEERGLPCPVGADEGLASTRFDAEAHAADDGRPPEGFVDVHQLDDRRHRRAPSAPGRRSPREVPPAGWPPRRPRPPRAPRT
jgi:hypothetical protein